MLHVWLMAGRLEIARSPLPLMAACCVLLELLAGGCGCLVDSLSMGELLFTLHSSRTSHVTTHYTPPPAHTCDLDFVQKVA
jgi:hypothetical protein